MFVYLSLGKSEKGDARETPEHAPRVLPPFSGIETLFSSATLRGVAILFLVEEGSLPGVAKVLVTKQATATLFTWCPSDTVGRSAGLEGEDGPGGSEPEAAAVTPPWRHGRDYEARHRRRHIICASSRSSRPPSTVRFTPPCSFAVASPSRHNEARLPRPPARRLERSGGTSLLLPVERAIRLSTARHFRAPLTSRVTRSTPVVAIDLPGTEQSLLNAIKNHKVDKKK